MDSIHVQNLIALTKELIYYIQSPAGELLRNIAAIVTSAIGVFVTGFKLEKLWRDRRHARLLMESAGVRSFTSDDFRKARRFYIEPDCSNIDPSSEHDLRKAVSVQQPIFSALKEELSPARGHSHILVLADSGMGKTTLLLNLYVRQMRKRSHQSIAIVPLNRSDAVDQIRRIENARGTILLLDALDEDSRAIGDYRQRLNELMQAAADFGKIVLTCRTQFFESDHAIPEQTGIYRVDPRSAAVRESEENLSFAGST